MRGFFFFLIAERIRFCKSEWYSRMGKTNDEGQRGYNFKEEPGVIGVGSHNRSS